VILYDSTPVSLITANHQDPYTKQTDYTEQKHTRRFFAAYFSDFSFNYANYLHQPLIQHLSLSSLINVYLQNAGQENN